MTRRNPRLWALLGLTLVAGCTKEVARIPFSAEGARGTTVELNAGVVDFWTDLSISYEGDAWLQYAVELRQHGNVVASTTCAPLGYLSARSFWVATNFGGSHSRSGSGRMTCSVTLAHGGPTRVEAKLSFIRRPSKISLTQADLVVKQ